MGRLQDEANRFRRAVNDRDATTIEALLSRYAGVWNVLLPSVKDLTRQIDEARKAGKTLSPSWLYRQERYKALIQQIGAEVEAYSQFASERVRQEVAASVRQAERDSLSLLDTATGTELGTWNRLPIEALNELIAVTQPDSPVSALFAALPKQAQAAVRSTLLAGLATGLNPRQIARQVRQATGYTAYRASTIARTESLRAYRTAAQETYSANSDVVLGWIWLAALSSRTCGVCLGLHGKRFPLKADFGTHPNCRCTQIPVTEEDYSIPTGEDWFREQPAEVQERILGKAKFAAYTEGQIRLADLIGERDDKEWGLVRFEKSLKDVLRGK